jgi:hypothetical protein
LLESLSDQELEVLEALQEAGDDVAAREFWDAHRATAEA